METSSASLLNSRFVLNVAIACAIALAGCQSISGTGNHPAKMENAMKLTQEWDKTFPKSEKVDHQKVTFKNRYGITLAADLYLPKSANGKLAALAVGGPFGAVKEQSSGLYAQTMAERGFVTLAFDPSYTGESGGEPRNVASPDINTEDFSAAVDFLGLQPFRRSRADRHHRHLRLGRHGTECRRRGQARQGRRGQHHVRHDARHVQGLQRQRDPRTAHANAGATEPAALGRMRRRGPRPTSRPTTTAAAAKRSSWSTTTTTT